MKKGCLAMAIAMTAAALAVFFGIAGYPGDAPTPKAAPALKVSLVMDKAAFDLGERMAVKVTVTNVSGETVGVKELDLDAQSVSFHVGWGRTKSLYTRHHPAYFAPKKYPTAALEPGKSVDKVFELPAVATGEYALSCLYNGMAGQSVASDPLTVTVRKKDGKGSLMAVVDTSLGAMRFALTPSEAMATTMQFVDLAQSGFYNTGKMKIYTVWKDKAFTTGDPNNNGSGRPGFTIPFEKNTARHDRGALSLLRTDANVHSGGCIFFVCVKNQFEFDGVYTPIGKIRDEESFKVVDAVNGAEVTGKNDKSLPFAPKTDIILKSVKIEPE